MRPASLCNGSFFTLEARYGSDLDAVLCTSWGAVLTPCNQHYGVHLGPVEVPVHEGMARYEDYGENFYYIQEDFMFDLAAKRGWHWNVIRPMGIIGYTPAGMSHGF